MLFGSWLETRSAQVLAAAARACWHVMGGVAWIYWPINHRDIRFGQRSVWLTACVAGDLSDPCSQNREGHAAPVRSCCAINVVVALALAFCEPCTDLPLDPLAQAMLTFSAYFHTRFLIAHVIKPSCGLTRSSRTMPLCPVEPQAPSFDPETAFTIGGANCPRGFGAPVWDSLVVAEQAFPASHHGHRWRKLHGGLSLVVPLV